LGYKAGRRTTVHFVLGQRRTNNGRCVLFKECPVADFAHSLTEIDADRH